MTNTWNIVMGVFDAGQQVVGRASRLIIGDTSIDLASVLPDLEARLHGEMDIRAAVRPVVSEPVRGHYHVGAYHLYFPLSATGA